MVAQTRDTTPTMDRTRPTGSSRGAWGSRDVGTMARPSSSATAAMGTLTRKMAPQAKCSRIHPPVTGPRATARPVTPAHVPMAFARSDGSVKTLVRMARVAGKMSAAPTPMAARAAISCSGRLGQAGEDRAHGEGDHAQLQGALAAEAVAQAARGEQQAGEDERVGVDHPLELAGAGAQLAADRRQRHVDDGVVDDDDEQAQAQHAEDRPAAALDRGSIHGEAPCVAIGTAIGGCLIDRTSL